MLNLGAVPILDFDDDPHDLTSEQMLADAGTGGPDVAVLAFLSEEVIEKVEGWQVNRVGTVPFVTIE